MDNKNIIRANGGSVAQLVGLLQTEKMSELLQSEELVDGYQKDQAPLAVKVKVTNLNKYIPDDEKPELSDENRVSLLSKAGILTRVDGMGNITGRLNDRIYAVIRVDTKGTRWYDFCQQLSDGTYSPKLSIKQADLFRLCGCRFDVNRIESRIERRKAATALSSITDTYLNSLFTTDLCSIYDILRCLNEASQFLPVQYEEENFTIEDLYQHILDVFKYESPSIVFEKKKSCYVLLSEGIDELSKLIGMPRLKMLRMLKENKLLNIQESSAGYQTKLRLYNVPVNVYCILDLEYLLEKAGLIEPKSYTDPLDLG